jgi:NADPH:quinone reductase-like Zn-dependent oxidoreductase
MLAKVLDVYQEHGVRPQIAQMFEWEEAKDAFAALNGQSAVGKIIIKVGKD